MKKKVVILASYVLVAALSAAAAFGLCAGQMRSSKLQQLQALIASMEVGDSVETTSGFYGVIIDITDDMVIVEFGGNKNCRIPMIKTAITRVEKANAE